MAKNQIDPRLPNSDWGHELRQFHGCGERAAPDELERLALNRGLLTLRGALETLGCDYSTLRGIAFGGSIERSVYGGQEYFSARDVLEVLRNWRRAAQAPPPPRTEYVPTGEPVSVGCDRTYSHQEITKIFGYE